MLQVLHGLRAFLLDFLQRTPGPLLDVFSMMGAHHFIQRTMKNTSDLGVTTSLKTLLIWVHVIKYCAPLKTVLITGAHQRAISYPSPRAHAWKSPPSCSWSGSSGRWTG